MKNFCRRSIMILLSGLFLLRLFTPAFAASASPQGLSNFSKDIPYSEDQFSDVSSSDWFAPYVKSACEYGLFVGTSANTFSP